MQRDYVLRLIEQAAAVLRALMARIGGEAPDLPATRRELHRALRLGGLDLDLLRVADGATVLQLVRPGADVEPARVWLAAETLFLEGLAAERAGDPADAVACLAKAQLLFRLVEPTTVLPTGFPEATERLAEIAEHLDALADPPGATDQPA
jgi:hypothetical protein